MDTQNIRSYHLQDATGMPYVKVGWIGYPQGNISKNFVFIKLTKTKQSQNTSERESVDMFTLKKILWKLSILKKYFCFFKKKVSGNKFDNVY